MKKKTEELNNEQQTDEQSQSTEHEIHKKKKHECVTEDQLIELTNTLKRIQAEFENYKKRVDKENSQLIKNSNANLINQLLPVLDSFELAIKNSNRNSNGNNEVDKFKKGLELIYAQLFSILADQGLRIIDTKDKKFDPYKHEVLLVQESDKPEDTILQEFQKGYMLNEIILRHSKVMISKHQSVKNETPENNEVKND